MQDIFKLIIWFCTSSSSPANLSTKYMYTIDIDEMKVFTTCQSLHVCSTGTTAKHNSKVVGLILVECTNKVIRCINYPSKVTIMS